MAHSARYRQMTAAVGFPTLRFVRVQSAINGLNGLQAGEIKEVENLLDKV
jgi:16S rRNA U516 pseudouridylate synthase RsuA-like enzyme